GFGNTPIARGGEFPVEGDEGGRTFGVETGIEAGFLNYRDPARSQDALLAFERVWGERPLAPNWRRLQALQSAVVEGSGPEGGPDQGQDDRGNTTGPPPLDISNVPRTAEAQDRVRSQRAELRYELGNVFFLSLAKPDSAASWYGLVVSQDADQPVVTRARYALAEVHGAQGRDAEAEVLYRQVIEDQPLSAQAAQARERLGLPPLEQEATVDTHALAEAAYDQAYGYWQDGSHSKAIGQMLDIGARASDDDVSPRALLASGLIFTEWVRRDSLDLERGIPGELVPEVLLDEVLAFSGEADAPPEEESEAPGEPDEEVVDDPGEEDEEGQDLPRKPDLLAPPPIAGGDDPREQARVEPQTPDIPTDSLVFDPLAIDTLGIETPAIDALALDPPVIDTLGIETPVIDVLNVDSMATDSLGIGLPEDDGHIEVAPDSLGGQTVFLSLDDLYHLVEARYPGTEYASHASARRAALDAVLNAVEEVREPGEDSLDVVVDVMAPLPQEVVDAAPEGTFGLSGDLPLNAEVGGFGWKVASVPSPLAAQAMLRNFSERGLRAAVVQEIEDRRELYVLLLGQFASVEEAEAVRDDLPKTGVGRDLEIVPIRGLELLDATDLDRLRPD
ncbi:MAG: SPOR domain-containing protein, partial [Bacteroidetes bacterium]|nr:SPOR domain-containing protein [Bacteroidota bacterium]